eukprot:32222-Eustigmatos_ZCMA.PRE.1
MPSTFSQPAGHGGASAICHPTPSYTTPTLPHISPSTHSSVWCAAWSPRIHGPTYLQQVPPGGKICCGMCVVVLNPFMRPRLS